MQPKTYKFDVFQALEQIDLKDRAFFYSLSEEQQGAFVPFLVLKWMSCVKDKDQLDKLNDHVNRFVLSLYKHKDLLFSLLITCGTGKKQFRKWDKVSKKQRKTSITVDVIKQYFNYNTKKAKDCLNLFTNDELIKYAKELGYEKEQLKELQDDGKVKKNTPITC